MMMQHDHVLKHENVKAFIVAELQLWEHGING